MCFQRTLKTHTKFWQKSMISFLYLATTTIITISLFFFYTMCNMKEYLIFLYVLLLPIFFIPFPPCIVFLLLVLDFFLDRSSGLKIGHDTYAAVVANFFCSTKIEEKIEKKLLNQMFSKLVGKFVHLGHFLIQAKEIQMQINSR